MADLRNAKETAMAAALELPSAWAFGAYRRGMGTAETHYRQRFACLAIKKELAWLGFQINLNNTVFGEWTETAVKTFQQQHQPDIGPVDGLVGRKTANALWKKRIEQQIVLHGWLRAQVHWESGDDPAAEFTNSDGSRDRGLIQANNWRKPLEDDEAFDPMTSIVYLGNYLGVRASQSTSCDVDEWKIAVGSWRTPVGAMDWCHDPDTTPSSEPDATWAQKAAYYVGRVDRDGRANWVDT